MPDAEPSVSSPASARLSLEEMVARIESISNEFEVSFDKGSFFVTQYDEDIHSTERLSVGWERARDNALQIYKNLRIVMDFSGFEQSNLIFTVRAKLLNVDYLVVEDGEITFDFTDGEGTTSLATSSPAPTPSETSTQQPEATVDPVETVTLGQQNALRSAKNYLSLMAFSHDGLADQLEFEGYTAEETSYALEQCDADWMEQAAKKAKEYLNTMAFSHDGLIDQLKFDKFTLEEAAHGADSCGADWNEQAAKKAQEYLAVMSFSKSGLIDQLRFDGFTNEQAEYGATKAGL